MVVDALGRQSAAGVDIAVLAASVSLPPVADFVFDKSTVEVGEIIEFESRTTGDYDGLVWDFGDGTRTRGPLVTHVYEEIGEYTVTLSAVSEVGRSTASTQITVVPGIVAPTAIIGSLPATVETGQFVTLRSASLGDPTSISWEFGDGTTGSGARVQHAWASPGTYLSSDEANPMNHLSRFALADRAMASP